MKKLLLALALVGGAAVQANAAIPAFPVFGCHLSATITSSEGAELIIARGETAYGTGTVACMDAFGRTTTDNVNIKMTTGGIGPAINGTLKGLNMFVATVGVSSVDGMYGAYHLGVGPRLGLIAARASVMAGVQASGNSLGLQVEVLIEDRFSIGIDIGGMEMEITPAQ